MTRWVAVRWVVVVVIGVLSAWPRAASAQAGRPRCRYGSDPVTFKCLPPPTEPPRPPELTLESEPSGATVYPAAPASTGGGCRSADATSFGRTPLVLTPAQGLKKGKQAFCLEAEDHVPRLVTVDVKPSGSTKPDRARLTPLARVVLVWSPDCPYRLPPGSFDVRVDASPARTRHAPARVALKPGNHELVVSAEGFAPKKYDADAGEPGASDQPLSVCLDASDVVVVRNAEDGHPLDGLYLRARNAQGDILWQGPAPVGTEPITVPRRPPDEPIISVFLDHYYTAPLPPERRRLQPSRTRRNELEISIARPRERIPDKVDRETLTNQCRLGSAESCRREAFLQAYQDRKHRADWQKLLDAPCGKGDIASCVALEPAPAVLEQLRAACVSRAAGDALDASLWLACLRLEQPALPGESFLEFDGKVPTYGVHDFDSFTLRLGAATTLERRPGVIAAYGISFNSLLAASFSIGLEFRFIDVAVLPAESADGAAQGYMGLVGVGAGLPLTFRSPSQWEIGLMPFVSGYYTRSAATAGVELSVAWAISSKDMVKLFGGAARFPSILEVAPQQREPRGGAFHAFLGLSYASLNQFR